MAQVQQPQDQQVEGHNRSCHSNSCDHCRMCHNSRSSYSQRFECCDSCYYRRSSRWTCSITAWCSRTEDGLKPQQLLVLSFPGAGWHSASYRIDLLYVWSLFQYFIYVFS
jgi:hypothetical protein